MAELTLKADTDGGLLTLLAGMFPAGANFAELKDLIMATTNAVADRLDALTGNLDKANASLDKIGGETSALVDESAKHATEIADLRKALEDAGVTSPTILAALGRAETSAQRLVDKAQSVDELVPDVPTPEPSPVPVLAGPEAPTTGEGSATAPAADDTGGTVVGGAVWGHERRA